MKQLLEFGIGHSIHRSRLQNQTDTGEESDANEIKMVAISVAMNFKKFRLVHYIANRAF